MSVINNLAQAEKKARLRDIENSKILSEEEMQLANNLQEKANANKFKLVPIRPYDSRIKFAQIIQENADYLEEIDYIDNKEIVFLWKISRKIGFGSNCIVDDIKKKNPVPLTQTDIALILKRTKNNINPIIRSLVKKGILAVSETGIGAKSKAKAYYVNPHILYAGDKKNVNPTLQTMFYNVPKELENLPVRLF